MTTSNPQVGNYATYQTNGSSALKTSFNPSALASLIASRNSRFHLDLSNHTLIGVLEAYALFKRKQSPRYKNSAVINAIKRLAEAIGIDEIMPIDVTDEFYGEFKEFLLSQPNARGHMMKPSSIGNYFDNIRAALSWGAKHRCPVSETFNSYSVESYEKTKIALTPSQISHIFYYDIDGNHKVIRALLETKEHKMRGFSFANLKRVQEQFVLMCNLGQRYSDAYRIDMSNFDETGTIYKVTQQKTGGHARVNLARYAIDRRIAFEILKRNEFRAPSSKMQINNFNAYLHLLLHVIGREFNEVVTTENKVHGQIITEKKPVWQMISSHTARRTFISYWVKQGESIPVIQKMSGHKDLRQISNYTIISDED